MKLTQFAICLIKQKKNASNEASFQGFTLLELLVVIVIIGILSAVALPSMLNQARRAREAGAQNDLGAVSRSQQAYRLENGAFASDVNALNISAPTSGNGYTYALGATSSTVAEFKATPNSAELRAFTGCATATNTASMTTTSISIEAALPGNLPPDC